MHWDILISISIKFLKVIFRWWKISLRSESRESRPGATYASHEDFLQNSSLQIQIAIVFGANILEHVFNLCQGM
ncbi:F-box only protein 36 [Patagioenas fasciata monilis]|uniref:F-box only protein 36 n=1 Tax=Patagioenas fasciata monilis TaxID=372326 RepID=A0A1V4K3Z0_PATFA|nr:F-box only protein 36 [Patagioenas fasciata monilis]